MFDFAANLLTRGAGLAGGLLLGWVLGRVTAGGTVVPAPFGPGDDGDDDDDDDGGGSDPDGGEILPPRLRHRHRFNQSLDAGLAAAE